MKHVLVIDDDSFSRTLLRLILEEEGYAVTQARNGHEGLEYYGRTPTDLVVVDIFMPEKDGLETIFELKERFPRAKVLTVSGGGNFGLEFLDVARQFGADDCLAKPFARAGLLAAVEALLGARTEGAPAPAAETPPLAEPAGESSDA